MLLVSIYCLFRHTGILSLGKEKMVQWTTPFMIGITNDGLNSDIVGQCFFSATNRLTYIIIQSTQKNLGKQKMGAWTSAFTIGVTNRFDLPPSYSWKINPNQP